MAFRDFYKCFVLKNMRRATCMKHVCQDNDDFGRGIARYFVHLAVADRLIIPTSHDVHEVNCVVNSVTSRVAVKMT